ncbi:hypothetical protein FEM48_Zijuj08G0022200 [Ziziphus jujuba var. spinosa]|uniref:G protein gamma domain-containing protein n=1 Tax=Ziziphus jujuba var. spinosa TaxID=714518 RepID=A0A978UWE1_ZIZJJ|nr:hypothetical protein FEM48_Zijuj08G0022200 [Ziziphus jujuba var. spinosa]
MAGQVGCSSSVPSLPPPCPKSPPEYPDLYGKRRETAKVQMLEREIGFLEEELRSVERIQPSSTCCKEVADFVVANPDPLIPTNRKNRRSCRFWKWLCASVFTVQWNPLLQLLMDLLLLLWWVLHSPRNAALLGLLFMQLQSMCLPHLSKLSKLSHLFMSKNSKVAMLAMFLVFTIPLL